MKFHPCKVRCLGALPQADLAPRGLWVHTGSSSGGHDRWHRSWTRVLPAEQGVVFWAPQLSSGWRRSPLSFQKGWEGHGAGLGVFYRTRGTPHVRVSGKTEDHGLRGQKAPSPHFPRQWEEHRPGHQSLRVLDSGPNNVTTSWNPRAILFPVGLSFPICKMSRLDSGIFQTVHWGDLKISQNLSQSLFHVFDSQGCPFPSPLFLTSFRLFCRLAFLIRFCLEKGCWGWKCLKTSQDSSDRKSAICTVMSDSSIRLAARSSVML